MWRLISLSCYRMYGCHGDVEDYGKFIRRIYLCVLQGRQEDQTVDQMHVKILWTECGDFVDRMWRFYGQNVEILWTECGDFVDRMWRFCGQNVEILWTECGDFVDRM
ncbi:hypothetical protein ACF0H5_007154 [Mactra antiquata]